MPASVKIEVRGARDLPIMDRTMQSDASTDAFVEVKLDSTMKKTSICHRSLNPSWNSMFQFEVVNDIALQDAPVEFRVLDQDHYSSELIGVVYVDLNPLLMRTAQGLDSRGQLKLDGWFPIFDTLQGMRGSLDIGIKLKIIGNDVHSSAGVHFFSSSTLLCNSFIIQEVLGFVVDLVVEDDSESIWQDYFRNTSKTKNDSRLKILYNLSAEVRREVGKKVLEIGGNAVLGYSAHFDIEGSSGLVARAYGTACRLLKVSEASVTLVSSQVESDVYADWGALGLPASSLTSSSCWHHQLDVPLALLPPQSERPADSLSQFVRPSATHYASDPIALLHLSPAHLPLSPLGDVSIDRANLFPSTNLSFVPLSPFGPISEKATTMQSPPVDTLNPSMFQSEVQLLSLSSFGCHVRIRLGT